MIDRFFAIFIVPQLSSSCVKERKEALNSVCDVPPGFSHGQWAQLNHVEALVSSSAPPAALASFGCHTCLELPVQFDLRHTGFPPHKSAIKQLHL